MAVNDAATRPHGATSRCKYCGAVIDSSYLYCPGCGATVGRSEKPTNSGWTELPPIKDMARLRVGASTCQIEGIYVPVADFNLAAGDGVYFSHHVLLWKDPQVELKRMVLANPITRSLLGMQVVMTEAHGPGHIAFSRDEPGEMIALPLQPGDAIDVREHLLLAATANVQYDWINSSAWYTTQRGEYHYPTGQFMDRFRAVDQPGLVLLHASGNVMVRRLEADQTMLIKPAALVYMDRSLRVGLQIQYVAGSLFGWHRLIWLHVAGPGRVAIQSAYEHAADGGEAISSYSNLLGNHSGNLRKAVDASVQSVRSPTMPAPHVDPRHVLVVEMVRRVMVGGQIPPDAMQGLLDFAAEHGLSPYDVRLIIKHVQSKGM